MAASVFWLLVMNTYIQHGAGILKSLLTEDYF